jgi:hypothetical protein
MRKRRESRQAKEAARTLDRVNQAENIAEDLGVVWFLFETHKLDVDHVEAFVSFGQEFAEQIVHGNGLRRQARAIGPAPVGYG